MLEDTLELSLSSISPPKQPSLFSHVLSLLKLPTPSQVSEHWDHLQFFLSPHTQPITHPESHLLSKFL